MKRRIWLYRGVFAMLWLALPVAFCLPATADESVEYQVKAGFLYNFAKFTEWPASKMGTAETPFVIGVFGNAAFMEVLQHTVSGKTVVNHRISVRRVVGAEDAQACDMLYVGNIARDSIGTILTKARDANVLTVGEGDAFITRGGVISFYAEGDKIRFSISRNAASKCGLKLSARLLSLAKIAD